MCFINYPKHSLADCVLKDDIHFDFGTILLFYIDLNMNEIHPQSLKEPEHILKMSGFTDFLF